MSAFVAIIVVATLVVALIYMYKLPASETEQPALCTVLCYDCLPFEEAQKSYPYLKSTELPSAYLVEVIMPDDGGKAMRVTYQITAEDYIERIDNSLNEIPEHWIMLDSEYVEDQEE